MGGFWVLSKGGSLSCLGRKDRPIGLGSKVFPKRETEVFLGDGQNECDPETDHYVSDRGGRTKGEDGFMLPRQDRGASLIMALLILLILTLIGISAISTTNFEVNIAGNERLYNEAFYAADAGIDYFYSISRSFLPGGDREYLVIPPNTAGILNSTDEGLDLGNGRFHIRWVVLRREMGPPEKIEFRVTSEGIVPSLPAAGRVVIEAVIEAVSESSQGPYPGGST